MAEVSGLVGHGESSLTRLLSEFNGHITNENVQAKSLDANYVLRNGTITATLLGDDSVTSAAIAADAVGSSEIAPDAVGSSEIATGAVGSAEIARLPACRVYSSVAQPIANATLTRLFFDSERHDTSTLHSTTIIINSRVRATVDGIYRVFASVLWAGGVANTRRFISLRVNGAVEIARHEHNSSANGESSMSIQTDYVFAATDYVELLVYHENGGVLNVGASDAVNAQGSCEFGMTFCCS